MRVCLYEPCGRAIPDSAPRNKDYCEPRCRTAAWKARKAAAAASGVVAVRSWVGDAENARMRLLRDAEHVMLGYPPNGSKRALELREQRQAGHVRSDKRVQHSRAVEEFAATLRFLNLAASEAERLARRAADRALPERWRP